ncbi:ABC transporter substrate-binding protein [Micromonospora cathayae]|uniref:Extracellular solute-binding protein n=1 Tax=Micromonospora cathayae TaxID=3028804 RepID=A0ABY7ZPI6_9ACTN|nr:extracellular solute-binding protein [Micromonospora sp. HUAS 3]WDZ83784.1 extracellular solute-binding protein [Micromonospora sp. HUAS 3]
MTESLGGLSRRHLLRAGALGAAAVGLAACGNSGSDGTTTSSGKTRVRLMGLFFLQDELAAARQIIDAFNAQSTTIEVQYVQQSWGTIDSKMTVAFSSGDVPELFHYYDAGLIPWGENGLLTDLKTLLPEDSWKNIIPGTLSSLTSPTKGVLGMPFETETPLIYYNTELFTANGIQPATLDNRWTWDQLRDTAARLSKPGDGMYGLSANWQAGEILFKNGLAWQAGAAPIKKDGDTFTIDANDPGTRASIDYLTDLFSRKIADPKGVDGDVVANFMTGSAAMLIRGAWARTQIPTVKGAKVKWAAMPFVKGPQANLGSGAAQTLSIPAAAKNKEAAAEFLRWWSKPENIAKINQAAGQLPPDTAALDVLRSSTNGKDYWDAAIAETAELQGQPYCPGWVPMLGKVWNPAMFAVLKGTSTYDRFAQVVNKDGTAAVRAAAGS